MAFTLQHPYLRLPAFIYPPKCLWRPRKFSHTPVCQAAGAKKAIAQMRQPPQKSLKVANKEALKADTLPNDIGLLPDTFIMPSGDNKPSFWRLPRERVMLEWFRLKKRAVDFAGVVYYKWGITQKPMPRPKLGIRNMGKVAQALHTRMYTAFAEADISTLSQTCTDGLLNSFRGRIASRASGERLCWTLHRYVRHPRVVSHRATLLPIGSGAALRQAVVKLHSKQSLARLRPNGDVVPGTGQVKDVSEYVVMQRLMWKEEEGPWMVWGTVEESDWRIVSTR